MKETYMSVILCVGSGTFKDRFQWEHRMDGATALPIVWRTVEIRSSV